MIRFPSLRRLWLIALAVALSAASAHADQLDDFVRAEMTRQNIPGLAMVVLKDGQIVKVAGYGLADRERKIPVTPETVFKIGSVSKQFLATAVMLLARDGRLRLDDPIRTHIRDVPQAWNAITIRHLLTHTAGLSREAPGFDAFQAQKDLDVIRSAYAQPLLFAPGTAWAYSNVGYYAIAEIISVTSGRHWSDYIRERIFTPVGMLATRTTTTTENVPNRAKGYTDNDQLREMPEWPALRPSGAFLSTVIDLAKWDAALYTHAVLTEAERREMWTPVTLANGNPHPYGYGWHVNAINGHPAVFHGGGLPGFIAGFTRYLDERISIALVMNTDDADDQAIGLGVARFYLPASSPR